MLARSLPDGCFILYRLAPSKSRPGKTDKFPIDPATLAVVSAQDPQYWRSYDDAAALAAMLGPPYGIGFVLTPGCGIACLDLDGCRDAEGQLSPLALQLCADLPEAAREVSVSGKGIHLWMRYSGPEPAHACKNVPLGIELYTSSRFIALGQAEGAIGADCTEALQAAIAKYFPPSAGVTATPPEWTDGPCEGWAGPTDDDELIRRARASKSASAGFGATASFDQLWTADAAALGRAYHDDDREYDASGADASAAQHLAFWTGKDCARMKRLMWRSALARDKWNREDYLERTILKAVARQTEVFVDVAARRREQVEEAMRIGEGSDVGRVAGTQTLGDMTERYMFVEDGQQVFDMQRPQWPIALADLKATLKASTTKVAVEGEFNRDGSPKEKTYETSTLWEKSPDRRIVQTFTFKAGAPLITRDPHGREAVNTWLPFDRSGPVGDAARFVEHVVYLFEEAAGRFLDWLAHIEQRPGELPHHGWLHISEEQGTGRNWVASVLARVWPGHAAINFDLKGMLNGGFNGALSRKLLVVVDEVKEGGSGARWENMETLKGAINAETRKVNPKYGRERVEFNAARWLMFSNHAEALPIDETDRRINVARLEGSPLSPSYYGGLYALLKDRAFINGVAHMLAARDITGFNPGAHAAPSAARESVIAASRSEADETLLQLVKYWPCDIIASSVLGELLTGQVGGRVTRAHEHALRRRGIRPRKTPIRTSTGLVRVSILRGHARWESADAHLIAAELAKGPAPSMGGARPYLDNLTAG